MAVHKKILIGVDFSDSSRLALRRGGALAERAGVAVDVVYVLKELPYESSLDSENFLKWSEATEAALAEELADFSREAFGEEIEAEEEVRVGSPDRELAAAAGESGADLILVGGHGKSALKRFFLGSVAESVVAQARVPVWVERGESYQPISSVILPTDFSANSRRGVLAGLDWARWLHVPVILLHIAETRYVPPLSLIDPQDYEKKMQVLAEQHFQKFADGLPLTGPTVERQLRVGHSTEEIEKFAKSRPGALLILATRGQGNSMRSLGSVASQVLRHVAGPTLLIPPNDFSAPF